jgi:hypothetical protein
MKLFLLRAVLPLLALLCFAGTASAQEIRYSWLDLSFMGQDTGLSGTLPTPGVPDQIVNIATTDGTGVRFRGSLGIWNNLYFMVDYGSTDIDLSGSVVNTTTGISQDFVDEFDYTTIRGGVGLKYSIFNKTDLFGEITFDSLDFDFGSFAGETWDMDRQEVGGTFGARTLLGDDFQVQVHARYSGVGSADLTTGFFDDDVLVGVGLAWQVIRGLSIVGDYESGEFSNWSIGFRLDLDED